MAGSKKNKNPRAPKTVRLRSYELQGLLVGRLGVASKTLIKGQFTNQVHSQKKHVWEIISN